MFKSIIFLILKHFEYNSKLGLNGQNVLVKDGKNTEMIVYQHMHI